MTFPDTPLPLITELRIGSDWVDISSDVLVRDGVDITRGKQNEDSQAAPAHAAFTVNNRLGKYSPRNPLGAYYGQIGRNTQIRNGIGSPALIFDELPTSDEFISTPDSMPLSITGDIDVRVDLSVDDVWVPGGTSGFGRALIAKEGNTAGSVIWQLRLEFNGTLTFIVNGGTSAFGTVAIPALPATGRRALRATLDADDGAGGHVVTFYTADTIAGPWTVLETMPLGGVATGIDSTGPVKVGCSRTDSTIYGAVLSAEVRNGIGGTLVANPIFTSAVAGASTLTDAQGNVWTVGNGATLENSIHANIRFWGEISSLPPKWDVSGRDAYVPIEASGMLRRLNQGVEPAESGLRVFTLSSNGLYAYWPLSGNPGTQYSLDIASGVTGTSRWYSEGAQFVYGESMGSEGNFLGTGMAMFNSIAGPMRFNVGHSFTDEAIDFVWQSDEFANFTLWVEDYVGCQWQLNMNAGIAQVTFTDPSVGSVAFAPSSTLSQLTDTQVHHGRLQMLRSGADTLWSFYIDGVSILSGTQAGHNLTGCNFGRVTYVRVGQQKVLLAHVTVWSAATATWPSAALCTLAAFGYDGEAAGTRISRLCGLASIPLQAVGDLTTTTLMGVQHSEGVLTQLQDAEKTDLGILTEPRGAFGLRYRTRSSMYNQTAAATINVAAGELAPPFEPVDDDQTTRNDITVTRRDGGSYRITKTTGVLSTLDPPSGVGRYRDEVDSNCQTDGQLAGIAQWLLSIGTLDEARYPTITVDRASRAVVINATLSAALLAVDIGDRIVITNANVANIYEDISLIVLGYAERMSAYGHDITFNCTPESPYNVAVYSAAAGGADRYDTDGSVLTAGVTSSATSLSVTATGSTLWTNAAGEFPFDINVAGERMTVTNITSVTSPQTFTVTRAVNGVAKAQSTGAAVRLWNTPRYAL